MVNLGLRRLLIRKIGQKGIKFSQKIIQKYVFDVKFSAEHGRPCRIFLKLQENSENRKNRTKFDQQSEFSGKYAIFRIFFEPKLF